MTTPYGPSQRSCINQALQSAGMSPDDINFIEAHGTGTPLGDPIEVEAIRQVFATETRAWQRKPLYLGAVKSVIGHLEGAAGIAGLLKAVGSLVHRQLPGNLHFSSLNPHINLKGAEGWIQFPKSEVVDLSPTGRDELVCGVSAFGFGGLYPYTPPAMPGHPPVTNKTPLACFPCWNIPESFFECFSKLRFGPRSRLIVLNRDE